MKRKWSEEKLIEKIKTFARKKLQMLAEKLETAISCDTSARIEKRIALANSVYKRLEDGTFRINREAAQELYRDLLRLSPIESKELRDRLDDLYPLEEEDDDVRDEFVAVRYDDDGRACYWNGWTFC